MVDAAVKLPEISFNEIHGALQAILEGSREDAPQTLIATALGSYPAALDEIRRLQKQGDGAFSKGCEVGAAQERESIVKMLQFGKIIAVSMSRDPNINRVISDTYDGIIFDLTGASQRPVIMGARLHDRDITEPLTGKPDEWERLELPQGERKQP